MEKIINKFIGSYCKIVVKKIKEPRASVLTGFIMDYDPNTGMIKVETKNGNTTVNKKDIVAIKPK